MVNATRLAMEVAESIPDVNYFINLILNGKLRKVEGYTQFDPNHNSTT